VRGRGGMGVAEPRPFARGPDPRGGADRDAAATRLNLRIEKHVLSRTVSDIKTSSRHAGDTDVVSIETRSADQPQNPWALEDSNLRPLACKASALPLS
jgi:hypothetical protein